MSSRNSGFAQGLESVNFDFSGMDVSVAFVMLSTMMLSKESVLPQGLALSKISSTLFEYALAIGLSSLSCLIS